MNNFPTTLARVSPHVVWFSPDSRTDRPSLAAVTGARGTLLLEAGASPSHINLFLAALAAEDIPAPRFAALTHWHWDHTFGASALDVPLIAHRETARQLGIQAGYHWNADALNQRVVDGTETTFCAEMIQREWADLSQIRIALPDVLFDDALTIDLGGVTCELHHVSGDHAADSVVMSIPQDGVLFIGDALYDNIYANPRHYTTANVFPLLDKLAIYHAEYVIAGHHPSVLSGDEFNAWLDDMRLIGQAVDELGADKEAVLARVAGKLSASEAIEDVDAFIAGVATSPPSRLST